MMTRQQSFKRRIRDRMAKTGESYTTARRHLLNQSAERATYAEPVPSGEATPPAETDARSGISGQALMRRTGRDWEQWFAVLDQWGAVQRQHADIARWLAEEHDVDAWWAQGITVGYEQARGLRVPGQRSDGSFTATASKTVAVTAERVLDAFVDEELRNRWLPGAPLHVQRWSSTSLRANWEDGATRVILNVSVKGADKCQAAVQHERLADSDAATQMKAYWRERLAALKALLEAESQGTAGRGEAGPSAGRAT